MSIVRMTARKKSEKASRRFALSGNVQQCDALQKLVLKTFKKTIRSSSVVSEVLN